MTDCPAIDPEDVRLSDYVDGALDPGARAAVAAHLDTCDACRALVRDLARIRTAARGLGPLAPPAAAWTRLEAALPSPRRQARAQWLGLAAGLVLVSVGAYALARLGAPATGPSHAGEPATATAGNAAGAASVETIEQELAAAAKHYETAITQLEAIANKDAGTLPPETAAKLQVSLVEVDKYIAESRAALAREPQSEPARDGLFEALRRKVSMLQDTVALMGAMQRGDQESAARIVGGKKS